MTRSDRIRIGILAAAGLLSACASCPEPAPPRPPSGRTTPVQVESRRTGQEIAVGGELFDIGTDVVLWTDPGGYDGYDESVSAGVPGAEPPVGRRYGERPDLGSREARSIADRVDQFVLHYDVAVVSRRCFDVLHHRRGLSVHFLLDADGTIYQTLDVAERAWHATIANDGAVGVEIAHIGAYPSPGHPEVQKVYDRDADGWFLSMPRWMGASGFRDPGFIARPRREGFITSVIQGRELHQLDFTDEQYEALAHLIAGLNTHLRIPIRAPRSADGSVRPARLRADELEAYRGVLGHWHVQANKIDPGPALDWDSVLERARALSDR